MSFRREYLVDDVGDTVVLITNSKFLVCSSKMSRLSPQFERVFSETPNKVVQLDEDPEAFHRICQLAHGNFVPEAHISIDTLVNMASIVRRYNVSATSQVYASVNFNFIIKTLRPATLPIAEMLKLLQVAKDLGSPKLRGLLREIYLQHGTCFEFVSSQGKENCASYLGKEDNLFAAKLLIRDIQFSF